MSTHIRKRRVMLAAAAVAPMLLFTACGGGSSSAGDDIEITLAHSYTQDQPQHRCGAQVIADEVEKADAGMSVEVFPNSQLGEDADRISSVVSGDIDMDIQGASALGAVYKPMSVVDAAYAFDDGEHLVRFFKGSASDDLTQGFTDKTGVRVMGAWSAGARQFTANKPIRTPADLDGLRMRFPESPQYLMNAKALGAKATGVAYEELYVALQQGTVDGQENPIVNIDAINLPEVQDYVSMSNHQVNSNLVVIGPVWDEMSQQQQKVLTEAVDKAVAKVPGCVEKDEARIVDEWESSGALKVVDDVDVDAFRSQVDDYMRQNLSGEQLSVYESIRESGK